MESGEIEACAPGGPHMSLEAGLCVWSPKRGRNIQKILPYWGPSSPQLEHLSSFQTAQRPPLVSILTRSGPPGAATPETLNAAGQRRGHELSLKNVLLGFPQAPFPITKVGQARRGDRKGAGGKPQESHLGT